MNQQLLGSWYDTLKEELEQEYFKNLKDTLRREYTTKRCMPSATQIFKVFELTPLESVRVVIVLQDPYPFDDSQKKPHAMGLALSSYSDEMPASLRTVIREVDRDVIRTEGLCEFKKAFPNSDLTPWAQKGVFLFNANLTVVAGFPNSHNHIGWQKFTGRVLQILDSHPNPKVFMLWGAEAQKLFKDNVKESKHLVLEAGHPASASHGVDKFSGCNHFSKANRWLKANNVEPIDWKLNEGKTEAGTVERQ